MQWIFFFFVTTKGNGILHQDSSSDSWKHDAKYKKLGEQDQTLHDFICIKCLELENP